MGFAFPLVGQLPAAAAQSRECARAQHARAEEYSAVLLP